MNIILDKSLITDSKQPKVFELGQITTTLQELLDNSTIVINGEQTIVLSITDENNNILKYLLPLDYKGDSFYGLGKNILENDLISLGSLETRPYKIYTALLTQSGTASPTAIVLENTLGNIVWTRYGVGNYKGTLNGAFVANKTVCPQFPALTFETNGTFTPISANGTPQFGWINAYCQNINEVFIDTYDMLAYSEWSTVFGSQFFIEIRVYD